MKKTMRKTIFVSILNMRIKLINYTFLKTKVKKYYRFIKHNYICSKNRCRLLLNRPQVVVAILEQIYVSYSNRKKIV